MVNAWGKVIGAALGLASAGPLGALLGLVVGHSVDAGLSQVGRTAHLVKVQAVFFAAVFKLLGHLAKADGRVSESEVAAVESLIGRLELDAAARRRAIQYFNTGKRPGFDPTAVLDELERYTRGHGQLRRLAVEMLLETALADGRLKPEGEAVLDRVGRSLGFTPGELAGMLRRRGGERSGPTPYEVLDVPPDASFEVVKRAYRRQMARHHPDKLVARGLPPEMLAVAAEKTTAIRQAYEQIRRERGL